MAKSRVLETDYKALADMTISYFQPFKQPCSQLYYRAAPLMWSPTYPLRTSTVEDQDLDYAELQGARDRVARTIKLPEGSISSNNRVGWFLFKFTIKVGDLYALEATFSNQGGYYWDSNNGFQYSYETPTFDDFTWSTSEGSVWIVSEIFNQYNGTGPNFLTNIDFETAGLTADKEEAEMSCELYFLAYNGDLTHIDNSSQSGGAGGYTQLYLHNFASRNSGEEEQKTTRSCGVRKATPKTG